MKEIDLSNPADCRWYCDNFEVPGKGHVTFVETATKRIEFATMTDAEAVSVANHLYQMQQDGERQAFHALKPNGGRLQ